MNLSIIREGKSPADTRVPLTPDQVAGLAKAFPDWTFSVQPSVDRCFSDEAYRSAGIEVKEDLSQADILIGVKEVPVDELLADKTYFFFSHTIKAQPYNKTLLQTILQRNIRLIDWECLQNEQGQRVIAFGFWAGVVGAHNGIMAWGRRTGAFQLPSVHSLEDYAALRAVYRDLTLPPFKVVLAGGGRVAGGAAEVLDGMGIGRVTPEEFLANAAFPHPVYVQLQNQDLYRRQADGGYEQAEFFANPGIYESTFSPYTKTADVMINAIYWDPAAPVYFSTEDMLQADFRIRTFADITCDIEGSLPATLRATTIDDPVMGYDPVSGKEVAPYAANCFDVMSVDNLPNELPRDASRAFGEQFIASVWPELQLKESAMIERATIARSGGLTPGYAYLEDYVQ